MKLGMVGLGRMGSNMVKRLLRGGHECVVHDVNPQAIAGLETEGARGARTIRELVAALEPPRAIWIMVPAGEITENAVQSLARELEPGDLLIDGGNSHYKDDIRRSRELEKRGIGYLDVGTSGGVWGLERGYCLMVGGTKESFKKLEPVFRTLAPGQAGIAPTRGMPAGSAREGYLHCGPGGAGHFVKMVHNGIEYGMMESLAEGFDLLEHSGFDLDLGAVAEVWRRGSVVSSWLLDLVARALAEDPELARFQGRVPDSGEGRWTVEAAIERAVPIEVLASALFRRFRSREERSFAEKMLSAMRYQFGGHDEAA